MSLSATLDTKNLENKLRIFSSGLGDIFTELLKPVGEEMASAARSRASFQNRTGKLFNSINFILDKKNNSGALTTRKSLGKSNAFYANFVESGINIQAKKSEYLTFKIDGQWKKVKSVQTKPRPFMKDIYYDYFGTGGKGYEALADQLIKKLNEEIS
jgi:hypothetical protein